MTIATMRGACPWAVAVALALLSLAPAAWAQKADPSCTKAFDQAQELRHNGRLRAAREQLVLCGADQCPTILRNECTKVLAELLDVAPSVVLAVRDERGADVVNVTVSVDGVNVADRLDGRALTLDPGPRKFRFTAPGKLAGEQTAVLLEGEKRRAISIVLRDDPAASRGPGGTPPAAPTPTPSPAGRTSPVLGLTFLGVGAALLGTALGVNLDATARVHELRDTCAPTCRDEEVDDARKRLLVSGVLGGAGAVSAVVGAVLLVTRGSGAPSTAQRALVTF